MNTLTQFNKQFGSYQTDRVVKRVENYLSKERFAPLKVILGYRGIDTHSKVVTGEVYAVVMHTKDGKVINHFIHTT